MYCGPWQSREADDEYHRIIGLLAANDGRYPAPSITPAVKADATVVELLAAFKEFADRRYRRPDGRSTNEVREYAYACRIVRELFGNRPVREFDGVALEAVRDRMVKTGWCRRRVNKQVRRVKRVFTWGVARNLVPPDTAAKVEALESLRRERRRPARRRSGNRYRIPRSRPPSLSFVRPSRRSSDCSA
jgi:hypothetical protein